MKKFSLVKGIGYSFIPLTFPSRPSTLPVNTQLSDIVALIGKNPKDAILCESLEEIQILFDLQENRDLQNLAWGIIQKP